MDREAQVDAVYIDFQSAFDCIFHEILLVKLTKLGAPDWFSSWVKCYPLEPYLKNGN